MTSSLLDEARKRLEIVLKLNPKHLHQNVMMTGLLIKMGMSNNAMEYAMRAQSIDPQKFHQQLSAAFSQAQKNINH